MGHHGRQWDEAGAPARCIPRLYPVKFNEWLLNSPSRAYSTPWRQQGRVAIITLISQGFVRKIEENTSRPVSRVLYGPGFPERGSHSSGTALARRLSRPTRMAGLETSCGRTRPAPSLFGLAPGGVYHAKGCCQPRGGLLPHLFTLAPARPGRFVFCGTFPEVTLAGRYPAPCFHGARTFLTPPPFGIGEARLPGRLVRRAYRS